MRTYGALKRLLDLCVAGILLVLTAPIQAAAALAIHLTMGRPVLFRQLRPGLHGKPFTLFKFRTMRLAQDHFGRDLPDSERLTWLGRWLRSTSIDELPQLINVVRGELSLVGPRPLLMEYLDRYSPRQARRHEVSPGITGWAQVNGRNSTSWNERFELDVWYVENRSLTLDFVILARTALTVLLRRGIAADGEATMSPFIGTVDPGIGSARIASRSYPEEA